jgi:hypothetical protein
MKATQLEALSLFRLIYGDDENIYDIVPSPFNLNVFYLEGVNTIYEVDIKDKTVEVMCEQYDY